MSTFSSLTYAVAFSTLLTAAAAASAVRLAAIGAGAQRKSSPFPAGSTLVTSRQASRAASMSSLSWAARPPRWHSNRPSPAAVSLADDRWAAAQVAPAVSATPAFNTLLFAAADSADDADVVASPGADADDGGSVGSISPNPEPPSDVADPGSVLDVADPGSVLDGVGPVVEGSTGDGVPEDANNAIDVVGHSPSGEYSFGYDTRTSEGAGHSRQESRDAQGTVRGSYTITQTDGTQRTVEYVADAAGGFRARVTTNEAGTGRAGPAAVEWISTTRDGAPLRPAPQRGDDTLPATTSGSEASGNPSPAAQPAAQPNSPAEPSQAVASSPSAAGGQKDEPMTPHHPPSSASSSGGSVQYAQRVTATSGTARSGFGPYQPIHSLRWNTARRSARVW